MRSPGSAHFSSLRILLTGMVLVTALIGSVWAQEASPSASSVSAASPSGSKLQDWIAANAVTVRSIDAADEDFSDLEPLIKAIGSARVVLLGEPSHGAGSSFAAKVRLIKFLHQRMGFDVLAWESRFYDLRLAQAGMRTAADPVTAAKRDILTIWSNAKEVKPLFEYVKAIQVSTRPLEMVGFDIQATAAGAEERFIAGRPTTCGGGWKKTIAAGRSLCGRITRTS